MAFEKRQEPFPHLVAADVLPAAEAALLLAELERQRTWRRVVRAFYELDILPAPHEVLKANIQLHLAKLFGELHEVAASQLDLNLTREAAIQVQRLRPGNGVGLHSDAADYALRLVVSLGTSSAPPSGGQLLLADPRTKQVTLVPPHHNTALAIPTASSVHGVTEQVRGSRYFILASFRQQARTNR